jgi:hypothetical protein
MAADRLDMVTFDMITPPPRIAAPAFITPGARADVRWVKVLAGVARGENGREQTIISSEPTQRVTASVCRAGVCVWPGECCIYRLM